MSILLRFFIDSPPLTKIHACVLHVKLTIEIDDGYIDKTQDKQIFRQPKHYEYFFPCTNPHKIKLVVTNPLHAARRESHFAKSETNVV